MTDRTQNQEPSMEEILASIRRIIAEEDGEEGGAAAPAAAGGTQPPRDDREDVLDLIDVVEPDPFDDPAPEPEPDPRGGNDFDDDDFGPGPSFAASADDDLFDAEPARPEAPAADPWDALQDDEDDDFASEPEPDPEPEPEPAPPPRPEPAPAPRPAAADGDGLMSQAASAATVAAFATLGQALTGGGPTEGRPQAAFGGRTLEELVADILRPLLKDWLDQNLPPMVERLVREEIQRLAERSLRS
ncbi:DUF2497 domain-containing protein [Tistrella mobilis]|uniref:DUF2497 domain-containing protein n=1 Tax=Tistrella mobilis TaxID=171437 RepID=UPI003558195A